MSKKNTKLRIPYPKPGIQFWFWMTDEEPNNGPPILCSSMVKDPDLQLLNNLITRHPLGESKAYTGAGVIDRSGRFNFNVIDAQEGMLEIIAAWVNKNISSQPELSRLRNMRILSLNKEGIVAKVFEDPALWNGIESTELGSVYLASKSLSQLKPGTKAWFEFGTGAEQQYLFISTHADDPKGSILAKQSQEIDKTGSFQKIRAILQCMEGSGKLILSSETRWSNWEKIVLTFVQQNPSLRPLLSASLVQMGEGKVLAVHPLLREESPKQLDRSIALLGAMKTEEELYYWLGAGHFVVEDSKGALRKSTEELRKTESGMHGRFALSEKGYILFRSTYAYNDFLLSLATWVKNHYRTHKQVLVLRKSRFCQVDSKGKVLSKHKDDSVWK